MELRFGVGVLLILMSILLSITIIISFLIRAKKTKVLYSFLCCQILILVWSLGQLLEVLSKDESIIYILMCIQTLAMACICLAWYIFTAEFTYKNIALSNPKLALFFLFPVFSFIASATNKSHHMFYTVFRKGYFQCGILFWVHLAICYSFILSGTYLLMKFHVTRLGKEKKQTILLMTAAFIPFITNIIHISKVFHEQVDITPMSLNLSLLLFAIATFKYRFLNIMPIMQKKIVDNINEPIVFLDIYGTMVEWNRLFYNTFLVNQAIKEFDNVNTLLESLKRNLIIDGNALEILNAIQFGNSGNTSGEITVTVPETTHFKVDVLPISNKRGKALGRVVLFSNISEYRKLLDELKTKNTALTETNKYLRNYSIIAEELAITKERNRMARDAHDTIGHTMSKIITTLEVCRITNDTDPVETRKKLNEALLFAREGLSEMRCSIAGLFPEKLASNSLTGILRNLFVGFMELGVKIDFTVDGTDNRNNSVYNNEIYKICQEALTNSLRHGKAENITIILRFESKTLVIYILDDGQGCKNIIKGSGLTGMEHRVRSLKGELQYGSDGEKGFNICIEIPLEGVGLNDKSLDCG